MVGRIRSIVTSVDGILLITCYKYGFHIIFYILNEESGMEIVDLPEKLTYAFCVDCRIDNPEELQNGLKKRAGVI